MVLLPSFGMAYPGTPSTWGTWNEDVYLGMTPAQISATTDPDGRLRATFVNTRAPAVETGFRQAIMFTYRRADASFRSSEAVSIYNGSPFGSAFTNSANPDFVKTAQASLPLRTKVRTAANSIGGFNVSACLMRSDVTGYNSLGNQYASCFATNPSPYPLFPRKPWGAGARNIANPGISEGINASSAIGMDLSTVGDVVAYADAGPPASSSLIARMYAQYYIGGQSLSFSFLNDYSQGNSTALGRVRSLDVALTEDGRDAYFLLNTALRVITPSNLISGLRLFRQRLTPSPLAATGVMTIAPIVNVTSPPASPNESLIADAKVLLTHATGEPKWIVYTDTYNAEIRIAKRLIPLPDGSSTDTNENRKISAGYVVQPQLANFSFGCDAALDALDRLHVVWWDPVGKLVHYARENASGVFEQITLPTPASGSPALAIGPGEYPYILYPGATAPNPGESAPLIVAIPPGLMTSYKGDFEDRDNDGISGIMEKVQGGSDLTADAPYVITPSLTTFPDSTKHMRLTYRMTTAAVRQGNTGDFLLADGADTISIKTAYSVNLSNGTFSTNGFVAGPDPISIPGKPRSRVTDDNFSVNFSPKQFYRLQVNRIPGVP